MKRRTNGLTEAEITGLIRERRGIFEAKVASGEIKVRPLTYTKPRGPSISGGPHGWRPTKREE